MNLNLSKKPLACAVGLFLLTATGTVFAAESVDDELRLLREQLSALSQRLDQLEDSNQALREENRQLAQKSQDNATTAQQARKEASEALALADTDDESSWVDTLAWSGDFRYRYENIEVEASDARSRSRIRARAALTAQVNDQMQVGIGMASGSTDPVSSNQTLGGGGSSKDLNLDLAFFKYKVTDHLTVLGGKYKQLQKPVGKNGLLWDSDWRPEGLGLVYDNGTLWASASGTWLESDSRNATSFAWIAEAGMRFELGDNTNLRTGLGYHQFDSAGRASYFGEGDFFGNSFDAATQTYQYNYHGLSLFGELSFDAFGLPALLYAEWLENQEAPEFNNGYVAGFQIGKASKVGTWAASYAYEDLEADAALGLLTDSDFGGGGTDGRGHVFKASYAFKDNVQFNGTYFINQIDGDLGTEKDFDRLQLDMAFKF